MIEKIRSHLSIKIFLTTFTVLISTFIVCFMILSTLLPKLYEQEVMNQFFELFDDFTTEIEKTSFDEISDFAKTFAFEHNADITINVEKDGINHELTYRFRVLGEDAEVIGMSFDIANIEGLRYSGSYETSLASVNQVTNIIASIIPFLLILILFISIIVAILYSYYLARPIVRLSQMSEQMSQLNFGKRYDLERPDEIGKLAYHLNEMSEKLEKALTDLQVANLKLQNDMEQERKQEKQRSDLFTAISHELKTPIAILKGVLGGMVDKVGVYKDRDTYLKNAYKTTESMERLVREILIISQLETKEIKLNFRKTSISKLINETCKIHEELASNRKIAISYYCDEDLSGLADESHLQSAFSNIVSNAIFHSKSGSFIEIQLLKEQDKGVLTIENFDTHIPEDDLKQLFQPFYRADKSRNRHTGGSGLGLFIVKNILDLHQFQYNIKNSEAGVIFTVTFPLN